MTAALEIPLFPLNTVLFPGGPLSLRVFETRYIDMVRRCLREDSAFGVVLIREGAEAGGPATTFDVGTRARIVDVSLHEDGILGIRAIGERRFRILERRREPDGLYIAGIELLPVETGSELPEEFVDLGPALAQVLAQFADVYAGVEPHTNNASWVAARLAELLPISMQRRQHCLELDDGIERLRYLRPMLESRQVQ